MNLETFWKDANWPSRRSIRALVKDMLITYSWNIHQPNQYQEWTRSIFMQILLQYVIQ